MNPFDLAGPQFLLFYLIFAGVVITGTVFWRKRGELIESPRIDLSDPYLIAYLRGGEKEVLRVATIALIDRGLLVSKGPQIKRAENASPGSVHKPIEKALLNKYARSGEASWIFEDDGLSKVCESYDKTLRQVRLLPDEWMKQRRLIRLAVASFLLGIVGFAKVLIALEAGRTNVGFLIVLMAVAILLAAWLSFPRLTESGKAMLEDVRNLYGGLRDRVALSEAGGAGVEPLMLAAVFGIGALAGPGFAYADDLFPGSRRREPQQTMDGGGGSCSSGGSSCGSSCGGGCGGCGGS